MRNLIWTLLLIVFLSSCGKTARQDADSSSQAKDSTEISVSKDSADRLLDSLRTKPLREGYQMTGDVRVDLLTYTGFQMGDAGYYLFKDDADSIYSFSGNSTDIDLIIPIDESNAGTALPDGVNIEDTGGNLPNPEFVNKKFKVYWRSVKLDKEPEDIMDLYYQEYDEIIHLELTK